MIVIGWQESCHDAFGNITALSLGIFRKIMSWDNQLLDQGFVFSIHMAVITIPGLFH